MEQKKLTRPVTGRTLCGVCAGLANYLNVDVTIVRLLFAIGTFLTAFITGIIAYLICVLIMPEDQA